MKKGSENHIEEQELKYNIGIIGVGGIGSALITSILNEHDKLGVVGINVFGRSSKQDEVTRISAIIKQNESSHEDFPINYTEDLNELGEKSNVVVVTIGRNERKDNIREDLTGVYFKDIKDIMEGIGNNNPTIFMVTNPITPNCLVANLYSQTNKPNIVGFTRLDYIRGRRILRDWLRSEGHNVDELRVDLDILGPHGYGLLPTRIKIKKVDIEEEGKISYNNNDIGLYFNRARTIESLSKAISDYGEEIQSYAHGETSAFFASEIVRSLECMLKGNKDTLAINVNLKDICSSNLQFPKTPMYMSVPVVYNKPMSPIISPTLDINRIPEKYRRSLLMTLKEEEKRIMNYIGSRKNFSKLKEHFGLN